MPIIVGPTGTGTGVELSAVWINDADDPSDYQAFVYAGEAIQVNTVVDVDARKLIGRRRLVRTGSSGPAETFSASLPRCTPSQVDWLRAHIGSPVCVRDHVGTKVFGFYKDLPRDIATAYRDRFDVKLSIESITYDESV